MKKIHRFILNESLPEQGGRLVLADRTLVHQLVRVLRLTLEEEIVIGDGRGYEARGKISELTPIEATVALGVPYQVSAEPKIVLHLYAALIRPELFALVVQKITELGVASITPLITERTVRTGFNKQRLETIAHEAAELSGRGRVPIINEPQFLTVLLQELKNSTGWWVADQGGQEIKLLAADSSPRSLCIGPEGGWTDQERMLFKERNIAAVSLGTTMLRAETAAIVGCFALLNHV